MNSKPIKKFLLYLFCFILSGCSMLFPSKHPPMTSQEERIGNKGIARGKTSLKGNGSPSPNGTGENAPRKR